MGKKVIKLFLCNRKEYKSYGFLHQFVVIDNIFDLQIYVQMTAVVLLIVIKFGSVHMYIHLTWTTSGNYALY